MCKDGAAEQIRMRGKIKKNEISGLARQVAAQLDIYNNNGLDGDSDSDGDDPSRDDGTGDRPMPDVLPGSTSTTMA